MRLRKEGYGAGCSEDAGHVIEPRNGYSRGQQDNPHGRTEENADGFQWPEGNSPEGVRASSQDTTGVSEQGMHPQG